MIRSNLHDKFERNPTSWRTSLNHFLWSSWSFGAETDVEINMTILFCLTAIFGNLLVVSVIITEPRDSRVQNVTVAWILIKKEYNLFVCLFWYISFTTNNKCRLVKFANQMRIENLKVKISYYINWRWSAVDKWMHGGVADGFYYHTKQKNWDLKLGNREKFI